MPITIRHGAKLEGRGLAYGAAAQAAFARRQREEQKKEEKKAKKLGDIGSVLSTAGAVATFIPGLQPVGVGLSIAGGALGQMAGGRGDPAGKAIATGAQGISQIYQAQAAKIEEREASFQDWQRRADYSQELSSVTKAATMAGESEKRDVQFTAEIRASGRKIANRLSAVMDASGMSDVSQEERIQILDDPQHPKHKIFKAGETKYNELKRKHNEELGEIKQRYADDPATWYENYDYERVAKARTEAAQLKEQKVNIERQEKEALALAEKDAKIIITSTNSIAGVEEEISANANRDPDDEKYLDALALDAKNEQLRMYRAVRDQALESQIEQKVTAYGVSPEARKAGRDAWIKQWAIEEAGPDADDTILLYYEGIATKWYERIRRGDKGTARELMNQMARVETLNEYGIPPAGGFYLLAQGISETQETGEALKKGPLKFGRGQRQSVTDDDLNEILQAWPGFG